MNAYKAVSRITKDKVPKIVKIIILPYVIVTLSFVSPTRAEIPPVFHSNISQIEGRPLFILTLASKTVSFSAERSVFRMWGAEITKDIPSELILGVFECQERGNFRDGNGEYIRIAECRNEAFDLSRKLVELKLAREICSETLNEYGTCGN